MAAGLIHRRVRCFFDQDLSVSLFGYLLIGPNRRWKRKTNTTTHQASGILLIDFWCDVRDAKKRLLFPAGTQRKTATLTCTFCGLSKEWNRTSGAIHYRYDQAQYVEGEFTIGAAFDPYFHETLLLQGACAQWILWAYNERHLEFLKNFVSAELRERKKDEKWGWSNRALESRLPKWVKLGKNRSAVLATIAKLEQLID